MKEKYISYLIIALIVLSSLVSFLLISKQEKTISDENYHLPVIKEFAKNNYKNKITVTPIPGYHFFVASMIKVFKTDDLAFIRGLSTIIGLFSALVFFKISKNIRKKSSKIKTLQFFFFPIIFPYFFVAFTEAFSLLLILITFYCLLLKKYKLSGIFGILSVAVRQNNIIWLGFFCLYILFKEYPGLVDIKQKKINFQFLKQYLRDIWMFIVGFFLFIIFVIVNKGVTMAEKTMHPLGFYEGNLYFILFLFFIFFLPLNISNFNKIYNLLKKKKIVIFLVILVFIIGISTFVSDHPYNQTHLVWWIRNRILSHVTSVLLLKIIFFLTVIYSILSLWVTKLNKKVYYLLYPISVLFLSLSWLIEQRFYIIPFTLFILFKEEKSKIVEYSTTAIFIGLTAYLFYGIQAYRFFL